MLLVIEIAMLIGGIYAIVFAKVPSILVGGGKYQVEGKTARWFGILLMLPLPISFLGGEFLGLLMGEDVAGYTMALEILVVLGAAILSVVLIRVVGKKNQPVNDVEAIIIKKAQGALVYALLNITGFTALICCPLSLVYARQASRLIDQHGIGEQYRGKIKIARAIAGITTLLWIAAFFCLASSVISGMQ